MLIPAPAASSTAPQLRVVAETSGVLFVDKPPGLGFHTEADALGVLPLLRAMQEAGDLTHQGRLFAVHRLDRVTSGLLMVAKTPDAATELARLLRERRAHKYYVALSGRQPRKKQGCVQGDMRRSRRGQWMLTRETHAPAVTRFLSRPLPEEDGADGSGARRDLRGFLLLPRTGKTHQLRVALKSLGSPVLGDALYADASAAAQEVRDAAASPPHPPARGREPSRGVDASTPRPSATDVQSPAVLSPQERAYLHAAALRLPATRALVSSDDLDAISEGEMASSAATDGNADCGASHGGGAFSVACRPRAGAAFASPGFGALWCAWFPGDRPPAAGDEWFGGTAVATRPVSAVEIE